ncbi:MAG TPA: TetR family transcriptional regulator [Candidatus Tumulicola sp.]|jgi:AcrR family transcriptional regulator|nr:TetR family transcriptional regulator [Candidatus Cybelea sp.]
MGRWRPDARQRLEKAALELYQERGFAQTTVTEVAERAGLTERTFFRHFVDKREVLFSAGDAFGQTLVEAIENAPSKLSPIDAVGVAVEATAAFFENRLEFVRVRQSVIAENPELQERERIKLASLVSLLADGLRRRGVADPAASLAAEMGITVFRIAMGRWINEPNGPSLAMLMRDSLDALKKVSAGKR